MIAYSPKQDAKVLEAGAGWKNSSEVLTSQNGLDLGALGRELVSVR